MGKNEINQITTDMRKTIRTILSAAAFIVAASCCNQNNTTTEMKYSSEPFKVGAEVPVETVKPGITRQVLCYNDDIMLVKVMFDETMVGQRPPLHTHPHSQSSYILSGKFELHIGDELKVLGPGDAYYAAPNVPHEAYVLEPGELIDGFSPMRETFIQE